MSLLEKAKAIKTSSRRTTEEEIDLAFAWLRDEVSSIQVAKAYGKKSVCLYRTAKAIKEAFNQGKIKIA